MRGPDVWRTDPWRLPVDWAEAAAQQSSIASLPGNLAMENAVTGAGWLAAEVLDLIVREKDLSAR